MHVMLTKKLKMFNKLKLITTLLAIPFISFTQQLSDTISMKRILNEVNVNALRAGEKTPVAFTNINQEEMNRRLNWCTYRGEPCRYE